MLGDNGLICPVLWQFLVCVNFPIIGVWSVSLYTVLWVGEQIIKGCLLEIVKWMEAVDGKLEFHLIGGIECDLNLLLKAFDPTGDIL
jgi:hypothetical protein